MTRDEAKRLMERVKRNHATLNGCPRHEFALPDPPDLTVRKVRCARCGGEVDVIKARWYLLGIEHATQAAE